MTNRRENFTYGDRTNFSFYDSIENYRKANPHRGKIFSAFIEGSIIKNGYVVYIRSVESENGEDLSALAINIQKPDYVFGPSFKLRNTEEDKERCRAVSKFIGQSEAAHEATKNSTLVFKIG